jgi:hypothetical protein
MITDTSGPFAVKMMILASSVLSGKCTVSSFQVARFVAFRPDISWISEK